MTIIDPKEEAAKRALAAATAQDATGRPASAVRRREVKLKDNGNVTIDAMTEDDCVDATKLIMDLFFKVRPQDILAKDRLKAEQAERVYAGLVEGVVESEDRLLLVAKVAGKLVGVAEVSLPGGSRFGAEKLRARRRPRTRPTSATSPSRRINAGEALASRSCVIVRGGDDGAPLPRQDVPSHQGG